MSPWHSSRHSQHVLGIDTLPSAGSQEDSTPRGPLLGWPMQQWDGQPPQATWAPQYHDLGMQELSPRQPRGVHVTAPQQHLTHSSDAGRWCSLPPHFQGSWLASYITRSLPEAENGPEHALFLVRQQLKPQKPHGQGRLSQWGVQSSQNLGREEPQPGHQPRGSVPTALS